VHEVHVGHSIWVEGDIKPHTINVGDMCWSIISLEHNFAISPSVLKTRHKCKRIKTNTNSGQTTGIQEELDTSCK
jgi:hypothetical protein